MIYSFISLYILYTSGNEKRIKNARAIDKTTFMYGIRGYSHGTQKLHASKG